MVDPHSTADGQSRSTSQTGPLLESALDQFNEDCRLYNRALGSYNTHLDNHRDRRDLQDIPFRAPITAHDAFEDTLDGDCDAVESLLDHLIDQAQLDSQLRRHPRTYPIHVEATEQLEIAREQLVRTLEEAFCHILEEN